jgi:hypothetical protein
MVELDQKGLALKARLSIVLYANILLSILKMFVLNPYSAFGDLFSCLMLYCGINQHHFCLVLMYMIMTLFDSFYMFCTIAYIVQIGQVTTKGLSSSSSALESSDIGSGIVLAFIAIMSLFYVVAIYYSFQTYKEFKA